jgi:DNA-binding MarR family transcriptional regulator
VVSERGRATATDLAKSVGVSQQAVSLAAKELEAAGYIERKKDPADKRKVWFYLTGRGLEKLASESRLGRVELERVIDASLTEADRKIVHAAVPVLRKIRVQSSDDQ